MYAIMNYNVYERLNYLEKLLKSDRKDALADAIDDAVKSGSTSTEILMRVRYLLIQFQQSNDTRLDKDTQNLIEEILSYVNKVLA